MGTCLFKHSSLLKVLPQWNSAVSSNISIWLHRIKPTTDHFPTEKRQPTKKKKKRSLSATRGKTVRRLHQRKDWRWDMRKRDQTRLESSFSSCSDRQRRKTGGHGTDWKRERRKRGVEETGEKGKWCLCGVRKRCVLCLLIGRWGGLRATDQGDLQGFAPSSVEAVCQPLPLQTLLPLPGAPPQVQLRAWALKGIAPP